MDQIALIVTAFGAGLLLRLLNVFEESSARFFNRFVIYISLPSLILLKIHGISSASGLAIPISMAWIHFAFAAIFFVGVGRLLKWKSTTVGALVLTGGLGNTSFVGFPLLETFWGKEHLPTAILLDQLGTFLVLSVVGVPAAAYFGGGAKQSLRELGFRVLKFPPFIALIIAFLLIPLTYPNWLNVTLDRFSGTLLPIALFSVGLQTKFSRRELREASLPLGIGLTFKLGIAPLLFAILYLQILGSHDVSTKVTVYLSAMAPMITAGIVASENGLNRPLVNLMLGVGIPLSLLTTTVWFYLLQ